jgi:hypothetical protein
MAEKMDIRFALFNSHINNAFNRASICFIEKFGAAKYCDIIAKYYNKGIMSIFSSLPIEETKYFVEKVQEIVNEE